TVASYLFVRGLERPSWTVWIAYAIVSALAAYAHFFALLVPLAHATSLLFVRPELLPWRKLVGSACLLVVLLGFLTYLIASNDPSHSVWVVGNRPGRVFTRIHNRPALGAAVLIVGGAVVLLGWWALARRLGPRLRSRETWTWSLLLAWIFVPVAVVAVVGVAYRP